MLAAVPARADEGTWKRNAVPRDPALPSVVVELGYPSAYVPTTSAPLTLRATGGSRPFNGYIGFRYATGRTRTHDVPVAARARIEPGGRWSFATTTQHSDRRRPLGGAAAGRDPLLRRELVIEWRNLDLDVVSAVRVGTPPWSRPRPLRIAMPLEAVQASALGTNPVVIAPGKLAPAAQWYAGFTSVITPVRTWLDLPIGTRNAVMASHVAIVFFGTPRAGQAITQTDQLLLPVEFLPAPGFFQVPYPYRTLEPTGRTPFSWRPRSGATYTGGGINPYIVQGGNSWYAAQEQALAGPLPALRAWSHGAWEERAERFAVPKRILDVARSPSTFVAFLAVAAIALGLWLVTTRSRQARGLIVAALLALAAFAASRAFRALRGGEVTERWNLSPLGLALHEVDERAHGHSPLGPLLEVAEPASWRTAGSDPVGRVEVRENGTLPEFGMRHGDRSWIAVRRTRLRQEPAPAVNVQLTKADRRSIQLRWQAPMSVQHVFATWYVGDQLYMGGVRVPGGLVGSVEIPFRGPSELDSDPWVSSSEIAPPHRLQVWLTSRQGRIRRQFVWSDWEPAATSRVVIGGELRASKPDTLRGVFMIPRHAMAPGFGFELRTQLPSGSVTSLRLDGPRGMLEGEQNRAGSPVATIGAEALASIASPGDLVVMEAIVAQPMEVETPVDASISIRKRP